MPDDTRRCLRCGSDSLIPDVRIVSRDSNASHEPIYLGVQTNPAAMLFKGEVRSTLHAQVCADCGAVELTAADPDALWRAHLERVASGWRDA